MAVTMAPEVEPPSPPSWDEVRSDPRFETAAPETRKRLLDVWFRKQANHALRTPTVDPDELSRVRYQKRLAELEIENPEQAAEDPDGLQRQVARDLVSASSRAVQRTLRDTDVLTKYRTGDYPEAYDMENDPPEILQWYQESGLAKTPNFQWATRRVGGEFQVNPALAIQNPVSFRESILQSDATDEEKLDALASYTDLRNAAQSNLAKEIRSKGGKSGWLFGETIEKDGEQVPRDQIFSDDPLFAAYITDANVEQYQKKGASAIPGLDPKNRDAVVDSLVRDWLPQQGMAELARQARRGDETARAQVFNLYRDTVLSLPELWVDAENAKDDFEKVRQLSPASGGRYVMNPKWAAASNPEVLAKEFARMKIPEPEAERLVEQAKAMRETSATRAISALLGAWYREGNELRPYSTAFEGGVPAVSGPGAVIGKALNERLGVGAANFRAWYRKNVDKYQSDAELLEAYKAQNKGVFAAFNNTIAKIQRGVVNAPLQGAQVIGAGGTALFGKGSEFMETASGAMKDLREASSIQGGVPFIDDIATEMTWLVSTMGLGNLASRGVRAGAQAVAGRSSNDLFRQMAHRSVANLARDGNVGAAYARLFGFTEMGAEATGARIARRFGAAGYYGTAGARSAGAIYSDAFEDAKQEALATGASESVATEIARSKAIVPAIAAGLTTTLLMKLVPGGTEKVFSGSLDDLTYSQLRKQLSEETLRQGLRSSEFRNTVVKTLAIGGAREGGKEALEEGLDELAQSTISLLAYDPDLTLKEALENSLHGAIVGGIMGSSIPVVDTGVRLGRDYREDSAEARQQEIRKEQRQDELLDQAAANGAPLTAAAVESVIQQGTAQPTAPAETAPEEAPPTAPPTTSAAEAPMPDTDDVKGMQTALEEVDAEIAATEAQKAEADARDPLSDEADEIDAKLAQLHAKKDFLAEQLGVLDVDEDAQPDTTAQEDQIPGVAEEPAPKAQTTPTQTTDENRTESSPRPSPEPDRDREQARPRPTAAGEPAAPAGPRTDAGTERGVTEQAAPEPSTPATPSEGTAPAPASEAPETTPQEPEETGGVSPTISPTPQQPPAPAPKKVKLFPSENLSFRTEGLEVDPQNITKVTKLVNANGEDVYFVEYTENGETFVAYSGELALEAHPKYVGPPNAEGQPATPTTNETQPTETQRPAAPAEPAPPAEPAAQPQPQPAPEPAAGGAEVQPGSGETGGTGDRDAAAGPGQADAGTTGGVRRQVPAGRPEPIVVGAGNLPEPRSDVAFDKYSSVSGFKLSPDQELGVRLIVDSYSGGNPGFLLGDGTGYGKTAQIVVAANEIANRSGKPVLIVTQNAEIIKNRFKPEMEALGIPTDGLIEITTYAQTRAKNRKLKHDRYEAVLLDEAHNVRNSDSKQSRAVAAISRGFTVYATATPMDTPEGAAYFMAEILGRSEEEVAAELGLEPYYKTDKDTKQQVRHWRLKARQFTHADFLDNLNRLRHEGVRKGGYLRRVFPFWGTVIVDSDHQLNSEQLDIEQEGISAWEEIISEKGPRTRGQAVLEQKKWAELEKLDIVFDKVRQQLSQGRKVVVFVETNENANLKGYPTSPTQERMGMPGAGLGAMLMKRLEDAGIRAVSFTGNKSAAKDAKYDAFQKKNTADVLVTTPQSGSTGIDLDDQLGDLPRHAIMATPNFSGNTFDQAVGRVSRRNSKSPATFEVVAFSNAAGDIHSAGTLRAKIRTLTAIQGGDPDAVDFGALTEAMDARDAEKEKGKGGSKQPKLPPTFPITGLNWVPAGAGKFTVVLDPEANPEVSEAAVRQFWKWWRANKAEFKQNDAYVRTVKDPTTGQSYWTAGIPERYLNQLQATQPAPTPPEAVVSAPEATASVTPEQRTIEASQEFPNKPPSETPEVQATADTPPPPKFTALEETRRTEEPTPPKEEKKPKKARGAIRILSGAERATIVNSGIYYDTAQLQQAFGLGTNKAKSTAAELEAEMAVKYPPQEPPPGNYKTVEEKDGGPRGKNIYRVYVDRTSGARQPRFSNNTFETAKQLSRDERIVVPSDIPLNPAISVDENNVVTRVKVPFDAEGNAVTPDKAIEVGRPGRGILTFDELWPRVVADKTEGQLRRGAEAEQTGKNLGKNMFLDSMVTVPYTLDVLRGFGMETGDPEQVALKHFESVFDNQATQANTPPENKDRARVKALNEVIEWLRLAKVQSRFALIRGGLDADSTLTQEQKDARFVETVDKIFPADFHDYLAKRRLGSNTKEGRVLAFEAYLNDRAERNDFEKDIRSWVSHIISVQLEQKAGRKKGLSAATISTEALGDDPGAVDRELDETRRDEIDEAPVVELKPEDPEQVRREEAARTLKLHGYTGSPHADDPAKLTEYEIGLAEIYRSFQLYVDNAMTASGRPSPGIISAEMMDQHLVKPIPITKKFWGQFPVESETAQKLYDEFFDNLQEQDSRNADAVRVDETVTRQIEAENTAEAGRLGLKNNEAETAKAALVQIAQDRNQPAHLRTAARLILTARPNFSGFTFDLIRDPREDFSGRFSPAGSPTAAPGGGPVVTLNLSKRGGRGLADTLVHELLHYTLDDILTNPRNETERRLAADLNKHRLRVAQAFARANAGFDDFIALWKRVIADEVDSKTDGQVVYEIATSRSPLAKSYKSDMTPAEKRELLFTIKGEEYGAMDVVNRHADLQYALFGKEGAPADYALKEFVTHLLTDPKLQSFMQRVGVEYTKSNGDTYRLFQGPAWQISLRNFGRFLTGQPGSIGQEFTNALDRVANLRDAGRLRNAYQSSAQAGVLRTRLEALVQAVGQNPQQQPTKFPDAQESRSETTNFTPPKDLRTGRPTTVPGAGEAHPDSLEEIRRSLAKRRFAEAKGFSELTSGGGTARPALPTVDLTSFGWGKPADVLANEGRDFMVNDIGMPATSVTPKELRSYVYGIGRDFYATPRVLDRVGKGSESVVFEDRDNPGVVWKFVSDNDFDPRSGWGLAFNPGANGFAGLTESRQERTIFDRIKVLERLGTPTEIVGTVERLNDLVLKQPQLDTSNIDPFEHVDDLGIDTNGVIMFQPPIGVVSNYAGTQNSYIVFVDGKFYLMADVRGANVGIDASGNVRILDPVIQEIPDYMVQSKEHKQFFADARKAQEDADRKRAEFESPDEQLSISAEGSLGAYHEFHAAQTFREAESIVLRGLEKVDPLVADEARAGFKELGYDNLDESDFRRLLADSAFHLLRNSSGESPIEGALPPALRESVGAILYAGVEEMQSIRDSGPPADGLRAARILTKVTDFRDGVDTEVSGLQNARAQWMRWDYPKRPEMSFLGESFVDPALYGTLGGSFGKDFKRWLTKEGKWGKEFFPIYVERQAGLKAISLSAELIERELRRLINKAKKSGNPVSTKVLNAALGTTTETADPNTLTAVKATFKTAKGDIFRDYMQQLKAAKALGRAGNFPASALRRRRAELVRKLKFEKAKQQYKDDLRQAYDRGAVQFRRRQAAAQAKLAKEHPEIYKAILKLRKQIDSLSMMVSRVAPDKDVEAKILGNLGVYLRRTYEWWDKSDYRKWLATADPEAAKIADAARKYFRNELVRENANAYIDAQAAHGNIIPFPQAVARAETMVTEDEVIKRLETWVHQLGNRAPEAYMGFLSKEIFLEKENIPLELREFLGVYDDNVFNATRTLSSLSEHMLNYGFLDSLKQQLTEIQNNLNAGKPLSEHEILITDDAEVARRRGLVPFVPSDKEKTVAKDAYGPLAGYYGPELLVEATHELRPVDFSALSRFARQAVGYSMAAKTVYSWRTHIRNFLGNPMFMLYSGNFSLLNPSGWSDLRTSMNSTIRMGKKSEPEIREFLVELAQLGVTSDNVDLNLIRELATSAREGDSAFARKMSPTIKKFAEAAARKAKARAKEAEELYSAEDDFWKIMIYLNELRRHATAFGVSDLTDAQQLTNAQADRILAVLPPKTPAGKNIVDKKERALFALKKGVADKSRAVTPHYSTTFEFIRQAKRHGLTTFVAPFVSFQAEVVRLTGANWALVKQEFAVPELRSIAIKRAGGALTAMTAGSLILKTLAGGLAWAFKSIAGGDDDELKDVDFLDMVFNTRLEADIRRFLPSYYKWNDIAIIGRTKTGSYLWLDISWMNPFSVLKKPVNAFFKNEDKGAGAAIQEAGMTAIEPYLSPQIWLKALFDQSATEQRAELMKDFDDAPALTAAKAMWNVFVGLAVPQTFVDLNKVRETIGKDIDRGRDVSTVTEAASFLFGAKVNTLDPYRQLEFRSLPQRRDQLREAEMIFNRPFRTESETTAEAMQEAYLQAQDARRRVLAATRHDVMAVGRLTGDPRGTLQILANSRLGNAEEQMVIGNVYQRWRPSNSMVERAARAQRSVGDSRIQDFLRYMDTVPEYNSLEDPIEPVSGEE